MLIATWNVNSAKARLETIVAWLKEASPDVACFQELKCEDQAFPRQTFEDLGYNVALHGQKTYNGVAILSKRPFDEVKTRLPGDDGDEQARYIEAAINGVVVGCLYAPNGNPQPGPKFAYKLAWNERLLEHAQELLDSKLPVILAGDYNVVPEPRDIYVTTSYRDNALVQAEPRAQFARLLAQGWTDALRKAFPDEPALYTFWDYMRNRWPRNAGLRLDHMLLSKKLSKALTAAGIDRDVRGREGASDHAPVWIEVKL